MSASTAANQVVSLEDQIVALRAEIDALDHKNFVGLNGVIIGKLKQQFGTTVFWYSQWNRNRDYSSVSNASMALGKLATLIDIVPFAVHNDAKMEPLVQSINHVFTQCWDNIQKASGRIVPFE